MSDTDRCVTLYGTIVSAESDVTDFGDGRTIEETVFTLRDDSGEIHRLGMAAPPDEAGIAPGVEVRVVVDRLGGYLEPNLPEVVEVIPVARSVVIGGRELAIEQGELF